MVKYYRILCEISYNKLLKITRNITHSLRFYRQSGAKQDKLHTPDGWLVSCIIAHTARYIMAKEPYNKVQHNIQYHISKHTASM